ncbi:hypothetical protein EYF80_003808 [Liparis tanakae]|uniref:Uncharacterized protein n=1 Tax=Liparis tanakae TaxID=230148 RepID=A0A4Z2J7T1_9TELE|nr:hypothetical protein EYF80_003808 [Liparis tanakae]
MNSPIVWKSSKNHCGGERSGGIQNGGSALSAAAFAARLRHGEYVPPTGSVAHLWAFPIRGISCSLGQRGKRLCEPAKWGAGRGSPSQDAEVSLPGGKRGSAGSAVGKAKVLVFGELRCSGGSSAPQACWGVSCSRGFRRRRRPSAGRGVRSGRGGVLAALRAPSFRVLLLRDELEQGSCHGGADGLAGSGRRPGLLGISEER